jgi:hypothetical protein
LALFAATAFRSHVSGGGVLRPFQARTTLDDAPPEAFAPIHIDDSRLVLTVEEGYAMLSEQSIILDVTAADGAFETRFLESLGHPVLVCHGPDFGKVCPALKGSCSLLEGAHGVVFQLDLERPVHRAILKRYQEVLAEDVPLYACVQPGQETKYADLLRGVHVLVGEPSAGELDGLASQVEASDMTR